MKPAKAQADRCPELCVAPEVAARLAALAHPTRLAIIARVAGSGCCCCKDVAAGLDLAQSTVSQHLKVLVEAGLLTYAPDRQRSRYAVNGEALADVSTRLSAFANACGGQGD